MIDKNFIIAFVISLCFTCCSHSINSTNYFNITLSSGGGFTGMYNGYYIDTLGNISSWEGRIFDMAGLKPVGKLTPDKLKELNTKINEKEILNIQYKKPGNIFSSISFKTAIITHAISWSGYEPEQDVPEKIKEFYSYIKTLITDSITK